MTWLQNALDRDDTGIGQGMETRHRYVWVQHHQHQLFEWARWGSKAIQLVSIVIAITYSIYTYQLCQAVNQQGQCYFDDKWDPEKGKVSHYSSITYICHNPYLTISFVPKSHRTVAILKMRCRFNFCCLLIKSQIRLHQVGLIVLWSILFSVMILICMNQ